MDEFERIMNRIYSLACILGASNLMILSSLYFYHFKNYFIQSILTASFLSISIQKTLIHRLVIRIWFN